MARKIVVNLDTSKEIYTIFKSKQNDDLILEVNVFENGEGLDLTNKEIAIQALKGDNTYIIQNTDITKLNNTFTAELVRNFTRVPGTTKIEVVLVEGGKQNTTFSFYLEVVGSVIRGAVESKDSITSLEKMQDAVIEIGKINEETQTLLNNAGAASKEEINKVNTQLADKAEKIYVDTKIGNMGNTKTFKGSCLFSALPTTNNKVDDYWYVTDKASNYCWNGTSWVDIGNNLNIGEKTVAPSKTTFFSVTKNLFDKDKIDIGKAVDITSGKKVNLASYNCLKENIKALESTVYTLSRKDDTQYFNAWASCYGDNGSYLGYVQMQNNSGVNQKSFTTLQGTKEINITYNTKVEETNIIWDEIQLEVGSVKTEYVGHWEFNNDYLLEPNKKIKTLENETNNIKEKINNVENSNINLESYDGLKYEEVDGEIYYQGAWFDKEINGVNHKCTINAGSEFYFKVEGATQITLNFTINTTLSTPYYTYSIDGSIPIRMVITDGTIPIPDLNPHNIRIVIDAVTETEAKWLQEKGIAFKDITLSEGATVKAIKPLNRKIVFYGDSIGEGVRALGSSASDATVQSATQSFPYYTCQKLNSVSYRLAFGGTKVGNGAGSGNVPTLKQRINQMTSTRKLPYFDNDIVVVEMGSNDGSTSNEEFKTNYRESLKLLKVRYSGRPIFCMIPLYNQLHAQDIRDVVAEFNNIYVIETKDWQGVTTADGIHFTSAGALKASEYIVKEIKKVMGKDYFL